MDSVEPLRLAVLLGHREDVGVLLVLVRHLVELRARGLVTVRARARARGRGRGRVRGRVRVRVRVGVRVGVRVRVRVRGRVSSARAAFCMSCLQRSSLPRFLYSLTW